MYVFQSAFVTLFFLYGSSSYIQPIIVLIITKAKMPDIIKYCIVLYCIA